MKGMKNIKKDPRDLSSDVIGSAISVHRGLGPGWHSPHQLQCASFEKRHSEFSELTSNTFMAFMVQNFHER